MTLADYVQAWLSVIGKSQRAVASAGGLTEPQLSEIARGVNDDPQWSTIQKVAKGLGITEGALLSGPPRSEEDGGVSERRQGAEVLDISELIQKRSAEDGTWQADVAHAIVLLGGALKRDSDRGPSQGETQPPRRGAASDH